MQSVYIVAAKRSAIGKYGGSLSTVRPDDLLAYAIQAVLKEVPNIDINEIDEVIAGAANQSGEDNRNVARMASLLAGLPVTVAGVTVNRLCASGLQAIIDGYRSIALGENQIVLAGGVESMTRAPFVMPKASQPFQRTTEIYDTTIGWRFTNPKLAEKYYPYSMGETAENVAQKLKISRQAQDEFAFQSQSKYQKAFEQGKFKAEIFGIEIQEGKTSRIFEVDEHPRLSTMEQLAKLKPAFVKDGTVTAGNSSGINDGSAMLLLANEKTVKKYNWKPMARIVAAASAGVDPAIMGLGPVPATQKVLKRAGLRLQDIDLIELNEAFAAQTIGCIQELGLNPEIVNVNGGAIALGHPLGCSGARITTTLLYEMHRRTNVRLGLSTLCIGVGQGLAMIVEKC
jgi:3-oxoadipyl-CoA thiolase